MTCTICLPDQPCSTHRPSSDPRVIAIRADQLVGRNSCSPVDECFSDLELIEELERQHCWKPVSALRWARRYHRLWAEMLTERGGW